MKLLSKYRAILLAAFLAFATIAPVAHAENPDIIARVKVPFAFDCGSTHYPAGVYDISRTAGNVMQIRGASLAGMVMVQTSDNFEPAKTGKAVFNVIGSQHMLREVWTPQSMTHIIFYSKKTRQQPAKLASNSTRTPDIELALLEQPR